MAASAAEHKKPAPAHDGTGSKTAQSPAGKSSTSSGKKPEVARAASTADKTGDKAANTSPATQPAGKSAAGGAGPGHTQASQAGPGKAEGGKNQAASGPVQAGDQSAKDQGQQQAAQRFDRMAVRAKLAVTEPGDAVEREADAIADKVMRAPAAPEKASPDKTPGRAAARPAEEAVSRAVAERPASSGKAGTGEAGAANAGAAKTGGAAGSSKASPAGERVQRAVESHAEQTPGRTPPTAAANEAGSGQKTEPQAGTRSQTPEVQRKEDSQTSEHAAAGRPTTATDLASRLGSGQPLDAATRAWFEPRLGRDLAEVRIHTDAGAAEAATQLGARAFTFGQHIAFATGEFQPDSDGGRRLLAHELAHVAQNEDATSVSAVQREANPRFKKADDIAPEAIDPVKDKKARPALETLKLPAIKARHAESYKKMAKSKTLKRPKGYDRENKPEFKTDQEKKWRAGIDLSAHYAKIPFKEGVSGQTASFFGAPKKTLGGGTAGDLLDSLKTPKWAPDGTWFETGMQIDHIVEAQVSGPDEFSNYELLSGPHNNSSGAKLSQAIRANLRTYLTAVDKNPSKKNVDLYLEQNDINFREVEGGGESKTNSEKSAQFWSSKQINAGAHLGWLKDDTPDAKEDGSKKNRFALYSFTGQGFIEAFALSGTTVSVGNSGRLHGINLKSIKLNKDFDKASPGSSIGTLNGSWELPKGVQGPEEPISVGLTAIAGKPYAGAMASLAPPTLNVNGASPVTFTQIDFLRGEVYANGTLKTTHEFFPDVNIPVRWRGDDFAFEHTFSTDNLKLSLPGVVVDDCSLTLSFGSRGLGAEGMVGFSVTGFGHGMISVGMKGGETPKLHARGTLTADRKLFDEAVITIGYDSDEGFSGKGTLAITNPDKVKGIKKARLTASYAKSVFSATGEVEPDIPGLKSASLTVTYDKTLVISGTLAIDDKVPGVESAQITVTVTEAADKWKVAASGEVTPKLPGLTGAKLTFSYDDGTVVMEGKFAIKKGPLDGEFMAGVTNARVNAKGERESRGSGRTFTAYGAAEIKADFLKDKLTGKLKLRLLPDGTIRVGGGLTVKDFKVFDRMPEKDELFRKTIDSPKVPIPGLGFSVGSVSVGVTFWGSGFIAATASVGPGKLTGITVEVEEFDPDKVTFADLVIKGKGSFEVPANAGLEIGASAHIGLSAAIVEADASIGITGKVGIPEEKQPVLKATSTFKYNERSGFDIQNELKLDISPALEFALKGAIAVKLNLLIDTITLWSKDWTLAKASFNLPIGLHAKGTLGYNSNKGLTTGVSDLIGVDKPDFDKPDNMRKILDGSGPDPVIVNTDTEGNVLSDEELMCLPEEPEPQVCSADDPDPLPVSSMDDSAGVSVMPKDAAEQGDDAGSVSSLQGGERGRPRSQNLSEDDINSLGAGAEMNLATRGFFEQRLGRDLSSVRIVVGSRADALARRIHARAFTVGERIVFADGEYRPDDEDGKLLLAHELAHVGQQRDGLARQLMREEEGDSPGSSGSSTSGTGSASAASTSTGSTSAGSTATGSSTSASSSSSSTTAGSSTPVPGTTGGGSGTPVTSATGGSGSGGTASSSDFVVNTPLEIPPIKARHSPAYQLLAGRRLLRRVAGYNSATRATAQVPGWLASSTADLNRVPADRRPSAASGMSLTLNVAGGTGTKVINEPDAAALNRRLKIPNWDAAGADIEYQVDHMVEFQVGGADDMQNFELLNQAHNGSVGSSFNYEIRRAVRAEIHANPTAAQLSGYSGPVDASNRPTPEGVMQWKNIVFTRVTVRARESRRREGGSSFWTRQQIDAMEHVLPLLGGRQPLDGTATRFALLSPTGNLLISHFNHGAEELNINVGRRAPGSRGGIAGFTIDRVRLNQGYNNAALDTPIGDVVGNIDLGPNISVPPQTVTLPITQAQAPGRFSGKIGAPTGGGLPTQAEFTPMSTLDLQDLSFGQGVFGRAVLHPSHPALQGLNIPATIRDGRVGLFYSVDASTLAQRLRVPGLSIDAATITFGYDGEAFSVAGGADFSIRNFGQGQLRAMVDSEGKFQLEGGFQADTRLFDRADLNLWYRSTTGFGGSGTLAITNPNKIRGIRSASVTASYDQGVFSASGTVEPNIPGLQSAGLSVRYGPDESGADSLLIAGDLQLAAGIPGISGGQLHVELAQREQQWSVAGQGDVRPNLPGVTSNVHLEYRDGIFSGELSLDYARSIFSGNVTLGLTNRPVTADGEAVPGGEPEEALKPYGSGTLNARLTPWLQGGVGLRLLPTGRFRISGRIGIPDAVTIFDQYPSPERARRELLRMPTVSVPLVGLAVGGNTVGLALTINGRVEGHAFVGPGRLTQAELNIDDFDPAQPESLHITGDARFNLPAEAGVDASIDAGVSLGAAVIRATAGINVSAGAAIRAEVSPAAHLDWRPSTGLHLHADLNASVSPALRFSVNGYAEVVADAFVTSFTLWRRDWNLAQREIGSSLALGLNVPVDYYSDERGVIFDPQAVSFQLPSLNGDTFDQLMNDNGTEQVQRPDAAGDRAAGTA